MNKALSVHDNIDTALERLDTEGFDTSWYKAKAPSERNTRCYFERKDAEGKKTGHAQMDKFGNQWLVVVK